MVTEAVTSRKQNLLITCASGSAGYASLKEFLSDEKFLSKFNVHCACYREAKDIKLKLVSQLKGIDKCHMIDADDTKSLTDPMREADVVFLIPSNAKNRVQHVKNFVDAAKQGGNVKFIVLLSWLPASDGGMRSLFDRQFSEMERYIEESGLRYAFLRCGLFQQTFFLFAPDISTKNVLPVSLKNGRCAPVNVRDAARMSICLFQDPSRHEYKAYHVTGPELLNGQEMAQQVSRALGREIRYINVLPGNCRKLMIDSGLEEWMADAIVEVYQDISDNKYAFETRDLVESMTGKSELRLYDFFLNNSDRFTHTQIGEKVTETTAEALPSAEEKAKREVKPAVKKVGGAGGVGEFRAEPTIAELERTKDTLQRWIFDQEGLISNLRDLVLRQESRLLDFNRLCDEVKEALYDARHREQQQQQQQEEKVQQQEQVGY